jgi:biopolymer transport protein ExbB
MEFILKLLQAFNPSADAFLFMWAILITGVFSVAIIVDRLIFLVSRAGYKPDLFMNTVMKHLKNDDTPAALKLCGRARKMVLSQIVKAGLDEADNGIERIRNAVEETMLRIIPQLEKRTGYLAVIGNVATLLGLLGTVYGLIMSFAAVGKPGIDAAQKSELLASGIATAMNSTFSGLSVAITAILVYAFLKAKTQKIIDGLDEYSLRLVNLLVEKSFKVRKFHIDTTQLKEGVGIHVLPNKISIYSDNKLVKEVIL